MSGRQFRVLVLTDIVDSTARLDEVGDVLWTALLAEHRQALRRLAARRGGQYLGHTGDGVLLSFHSPGPALRCAWELTEQAQALDLPVRVGVHAGEVEQIEDGVGGLAVHSVARVTAKAEAGEVVASPAVVLLVAGGDLAFDDLGEHTLKGLAAPWRLWRLHPPPSEGSERSVDRPPTGRADLASASLPGRLSAKPAAGVVGRVLERERLAALQKAAFSGDGHRVVLLSGEPGIGKTTMAADLGQRSAAGGATVLYGRCDEDLGLPYQPFLEALGDVVARVDEAALLTVDERHLSELSRLLPRVRDRIPGLAEPASTDADAERYLLFGAIRGVLSAMSARAPVLLVLDDLHWADSSTVLLLRHLVATLDRAPVLIVGTYRDSDLTASHPLTVGLAALRREPSVDRLALSGLDDTGIVALLAGLAGHDLDDEGIELAHDVRRDTGGNPFFAAEVLRHLSETGAIRQEGGRWVAAVDLSDIGLPDSVHEVVGHRVRRLGDEVEQILTIASVIGREFDLALLARAAERDADVVLDTLELASRAAVVAEVAGAQDRFTFSHALFQRSLYEQLSASRRARTHRRIGELLEQDCGDQPGDRIGELAHHWMAATRPADADKATRYAWLAGTRALRALAPDEAIRWFRQALELTAGEEPLDPHQRLDILIGLGDAQRQAGDPAHRNTLLNASAEAARLGDTGRLVDAVLANQRGTVSSTGAVDEERIDMLQRALAAVGSRDSRARAWLLASLAAERTAAGDVQRVRVLAAEAEATARRLGDAATLLRVLNVTFLPLWLPDGFDRSVAASAEALTLAERVGDPVASFWAATNRIYAMASSLDRAGIDAALELAAPLAEKVGQPYLTWQVLYIRCMLVLLTGDAEGAERLAEAALQMAMDSGQPDALVVYGGNLAGIRVHQGRLDEILPLIEQAARETPGVPAFAAAHAMMLCECGRLDEARPLLEAARSADFHHAAYDWIWLTTTTVWADVAAWLEDEPAARVLSERLAPFETLGAVSGSTFNGTVGMYLARLATVLGDHSEAQRLFEQADAQLRPLGAPFWHARNQVEWAQLLLRLGTETDRARALLAEARSTAVAFGCGGIERRALELAATLDDRP